MKNRLFKISVFCLIAEVFSVSHLFAENADSVNHTSLSSEKILLLKTNWNDSENPASLHFFNIQQKIGKAELVFNYEKGEHHLFQEEKENISPGFFTNGYVKLNNWKFYGDFSYFKQTQNGVKWTDVLEPYNDNPYTLGDKVGGTYYNEFFNMRAKAAYQINKLLVFGFDVQYNTGMGARRKDPRPQNEITRFDFSPGIIFNFSKIKMGANFNYQTSKEDIELTTVTDSIYDFYHFKGLGSFTSTTESDDRSSETELLGAGLQVNFNGKNLSNVSEFNFSRKETDINRGETFPLQVVLLEKFTSSFSSTFQFLKANNSIKKLHLAFSDKRIFGHEPVVEPKLQQVSYQWNTLAKYTLYWFKQQQFGVNYSYYKIIDANRFNWGGKLSGQVTSSESTYYFVPEYNRQKLNYFQINALFEKEILLYSLDFIFSLNSNYRKGFNASLELVNDEVLLENVQTDFVTHDFNYFNQPEFTFGGAIEMGKNLNMYNSAIQLYLKLDYNRRISQMNENPFRNITSVKLGMNF